MRTLKKTLLLALTALAAVAMAAPVTASAAQWTEEGEPLTQEAAIQLDGQLGWYSTGGGGNAYFCDFEAEAQIYPGGEGEITKFDVVKQGSSMACDGGGAWAGCNSQNGEGFHTVGLPWKFDPAEDGTVSSEHYVAFLFDENSCWASQYPFVQKGTFSLTPDNQSAITSLSVFQAAASPGWMLTGNLDVTPAGVYGIE